MIYRASAPFRDCVAIFRGTYQGLTGLLQPSDPTGIYARLL